jgi:phage gp16-like protein
MAISVAPPPGARVGLKTALRATDMASARFLSISLRMSFDGPRRRIVQALGVVHSVRNVKYLRRVHIN